jgi:hypothetical protein
VEQRSAELKARWADARADRQAGDHSAEPLAKLLETIALAVLKRLYPRAT